MNFTFIPKEKISETLAAAPQDGKRLLEPLKSLSAASGAPINILEDRNVANEAEAHRHEADLWHCLEGEVTFICGGEMAEPWPKKNADGSVDEREWKAKEIKGGTELVMRPGDWLHIPAGVPHQHRCAGTARLVIIKIPKV